MIRERKMDEDVREEHYVLTEAYRRALGLLAEIGPLGEAAVRAEEARRARPRSTITPEEANARAQTHLYGPADDPAADEHELFQISNQQPADVFDEDGEYDPP
jgi:hypothetical protein